MLTFPTLHATRLPRLRYGRAAVLLAVAGAACADPSTAPLPSPSVEPGAVRPMLQVTGTTSVLRVCKASTSPAGTYAFSAAAGGNANPGDVLVSAFSLTVPTGTGDPACTDVFTRVEADEGGDQPALITIVEAVAPGTMLAAVTVETYGPNSPITTPPPAINLETRTATIAVNAYHGALTTFFNSAATHGCTYTQGWYKNRGAESLPAGTFYSSGQSYLDVLNTSAGKGNVYYILAHQFIAASQNATSATVPLSVQTALDAAAAYFAVASPTNGLPSPYSRAQVVGWATTLDEYNNGRLGTPHCS